MRSTRLSGLFSCLCLVAVVVACSTGEGDVTREEARRLGQEGDLSKTKADVPDPCDSFGFYGDGSCDLFCPKFDTDCSVPSPPDLDAGAGGGYADAGGCGGGYADAGGSDPCWGAFRDHNGTCRSPSDGVYPDYCCCEPVICDLWCEWGYTKDEYGCDTCGCAPPNPGPCSSDMCPIWCDWGYVQDENGCNTCACNPPPDPFRCPVVMCDINCPAGLAKDETGCEICECADDRFPVNGGCNKSSNDTCQTDADCMVGGCGGELCYNPAVSSGASTCEFAGPSPDASACGCLEGRCTWWSA